MAADRSPALLRKILSEHQLTNQLLHELLKKEQNIMKELDDLEVQVKANRDAEQSAIVLLNGIADRINAAGGDPTKLKQLSDDLKSSGDALAAAVVANTPAAPPA